MDKIIENTLLRTFRKVRERPMGEAEIVGLMVNFYKMEIGSHSNIDTRKFYLCRKDSITYFRGKDTSYYENNEKKLYEGLKELSISEFYSLYLRSAFETSSTETYDPIIRDVISVEGFLRTYQKP